MPIRNRIDMLSTGVRAPIGIKVLGPGDVGGWILEAKRLQEQLDLLTGSATRDSSERRSRSWTWRVSPP